MKRILFVDDDPQVLSGLKRVLYPYRHEWEMEFVASGEEALKRLAESAFDVLVTDIRMAGITGIELLSQVVKLHPDVLRIVLSGTADQEITLKTVELAHQSLMKPCQPQVLRATIERALNLRLMLEESSLRAVVSSLRSLPSLPTVYVDLMKAIESPHVSAVDVGKIVARDMGMVSKVLQLVNSAFFGAGQKIVDPVAATVYLGFDTIRALALQVAVFSQFNSKLIPAFSINALQEHSLRVATIAKLIATNADLPRTTTNDCLAGGFLHDIGKLVLASNFPERYNSVLNHSIKESIPVRKAEALEFGTTHAEVGAYLLWLWGIPAPLTEMVGLHHRPPVEPGEVSPTAIVYLANNMDRARQEEDVEAHRAEMVRTSGISWEELTFGIQQKRTNDETRLVC